MSYSIIGKIINTNTKEVLAEGFFDGLKNINSHSYSAELRNVDETFPDFDTSEFTKYEDETLVGVFESTILEDHPEIPFAVVKKMYSEEMNDKIRAIWKEDYDKYLPIFEKYKSSPLNASNEDGFIYLSVREIKHSQSYWYTLNNFESAEVKYKKEYDDAVAELTRLRTIKNSLDYYRLDENGKNDLLGDIGYAEDDVEEKRYALDAVRYIANILDFYEDNYIDKDERWNRNIILCLTT